MMMQVLSLGLAVPKAWTGAQCDSRGHRATAEKSPPDSTPLYGNWTLCPWWNEALKDYVPLRQRAHGSSHVHPEQRNVPVLLQCWQLSINNCDLSLELSWKNIKRLSLFKTQLVSLHNEETKRTLFFLHLLCFSVMLRSTPEQHPLMLLGNTALGKKS